MKLEKTLKSLDSLDSKFHSLYVAQADGTFKLDVELPTVEVEKVVTKEDETKIKELQSQLEKLQGRSAQTVDVYKTQLEQLQTTVKELQKKSAESEQRLSQELLKSTVSKVLSNYPLQKGADEDVMERVLGVFTIKDGKITTDLVSKKDPTKPMEISEFVDGIKESKPYLFKTATGTNTTPKFNISEFKGSNPFSKATWDFGKQMELMLKDKDQYDQLKAAAAAG